MGREVFTVTGQKNKAALHIKGNWSRPGRCGEDCGRDTRRVCVGPAINVVSGPSSCRGLNFGLARSALDVTWYAVFYQVFQATSAISGNL